MEQKCPHCGADLPENAAFCPHCAKDIHGRKKPRRPVPLQKKLLLGLLTLVVVIAAGAGLWYLNRPYEPQEYDGEGEVYYERGDKTYQLLVAWPDDRTAPAADIYHQGAPDEQYRWPSRWYVNDALTGTDAWEEFEPLVEKVTVEVVQDENAADELTAGEPSHQEDYSPDAAMVSSLDFTGNSGEPQVVWTVQMKNGDLIRVRQNIHITPVITHEYHWQDYPMSTAEEVQALLDRATEPEYGPALPVHTAEGLRVLPYARIEFLECTHHIVHFHLTNGQALSSLSLRVPFTTVAAPLLADDRFLQPHRSFVVNLAAVRLLAAGEIQMASGARIPLPRSRETAVRQALLTWLEQGGGQAAPNP